MALEHWHLLSLVVAFGLVSLASDRIGASFRHYPLPLITGFLFTGVLAGPYSLDLISRETVQGLHFVDQVSLAVIAFAAGNELYIEELRSRLRNIIWLTVGLVVCTFVLGVVAIYLLADYIPFMADLSPTGRLAVALLAAAILIARSPSSAIAIVNEMRANGPFAKTALGVTVGTDIVVIVVFATCFSVATGLLSTGPYHLGSLGVLVVELFGSVAIGCAVGWLLDAFLKRAVNILLRKIVVLVAGYAVFAGSAQLLDWSSVALPVHIHVEPLLVCMVASFWLTNFSDADARTGFTRLLHRVSPPVYVAFFTLTGASLELSVLPDTWHLALAFFGIRLAGIWLGAHAGGLVTGSRARYRRIGWMAYITQAGVALGLAKNVASAFPTWGPGFATTIVALIVFNQVVGPPLMKLSISLAGEDRSRGDTAAFDGDRDVLIVGVEGQSLALAHMLRESGWQVRMACPDSTERRQVGDQDIWVEPMETIDLDALQKLGGDGVDAIVSMLDDQQNLAICELAYQHFGTRVLVARLDDGKFLPRYDELDVVVIDPRAAVVGLLERAVRSPTSAALLLGKDAGQDMIDVDVANKDLSGVAVRDLRLPLDVALLYVHREGTMIQSKGTTKLQVGDRVTLSGPVECLEKATLKLGG